MITKQTTYVVTCQFCGYSRSSSVEADAQGWDEFHKHDCPAMNAANAAACNTNETAFFLLGWKKSREYERTRKEKGLTPTPPAV